MNRPETDGFDEKDNGTGMEVGVGQEEDTGVGQEVGQEVEEEVEEEDVGADVGSEDSMEDMDGIQIAPSGEDAELSEDDLLLFVQLGDRILIDSQKYHGKVIGTVYYRSLERICIKPDGVSDALREFELEQTEDEERYRDEDGVSAVYVLEKRVVESFVEQQDFRINQVVDALDNTGNLVHSYRVMEVDKENDSIRLQEVEDEESEKVIEFGFVGIPQEEGIAILSIRSFVGDEADAPNEVPPSNESDAEAKAEEDEEEEANNDEPFNEEQNKINRIQMLGKVQIVRPMIYREALSYEQRIPDHLQKIDALNDFINTLDPSLQKDPKALREIRMLVETLYALNKDSIEYDAEGSIAGPKRASIETIAELVEAAVLPMGRPVLQVTKKLYTYESDEAEEDTEVKEDEEVFIKSFERELNEVIHHKAPVGSSVAPEWLRQQSFAKLVAPWISSRQSKPQWTALSDSEFFRSSPPSTEEVSEGVYTLLPTVEGYLPPPYGSPADSPLTQDEIPFGIERALTTTYRKGTDRKKQVILPANRATMNSFLLFPQQAIPHIGKKRSYNLAIDSGRSQLSRKTMRTLLEELGEPTDMGGTSKNILLLSASGESLGNIPLHDYIEGLSIPSLGWGDVFQTLVHYGLDNYDLHKDTARVLKKKMTLYQAQLTTSLGALRNALAEQAGKVIDPATLENLLLPATDLWRLIESQDVLVRSLREYEKYNPTMASSDIGRTLYLTNRHDNFFQVTVGQSPFLIAKAVKEAYNHEYLDALRIQSLLLKLERDAGSRPKKNKCPHVADLVSVRKITEDADRFYELTKVFKRYQGERTDNWFNCNICKEHLICIHERLQLQAFLHPREKEILEKEIILKCSGGQFQGRYICRNCGQTIREMDFDNHTEYDDDGNPRFGRNQLVDDDALFEEKLDDIVSAPVGGADPLRLQLTPMEQGYYEVIRVLSESVGVYPPEKRMKVMLQRTLQYINKLPTRDIYAKIPGKKLDYDVYHARHLIAFCSIFLLIDIQTQTPPYIIRYKIPGCKSPGFDGYPLDPDATKREGIEYLACAVASTHRKESPWKDTGYNQEKDDNKRSNAVILYMTRLMEKVIDDPMIRADLSEKRKYIIDVLGMSSSAGADGVPKDMVFPSFLPELTLPTMEESVANAITPEIAEKMGYRGRMSLVKLWIRQAHKFASENTTLLHGSPLLETTCCVTPIGSPGEAWTSDAFPPIGRRQITPHVQGAAMITHFIPRESGKGVVEPNSELFYRIFLKYCYTGPHMGQSHELDLTYRCIWCSFQFPMHPRIMDTAVEEAGGKKGEIGAPSSQGKAALLSQEIQMDAVAFHTLLDTIHRVHTVAPVSSRVITRFMELMTDISEMDPPPFPQEQWKGLIGETADAFMKMNRNASAENIKDEILLAVGPLSDVARNYQEQIRPRIPPKIMALLDEITELPWNDFFQVIQTYFVIFFQRILSGFSEDTLFITQELSTTLSDTHNDMLRALLKNQMTDLRGVSVSWETPKYELARAKLEYYILQMSEIITYKDRIRPLAIPGRQSTLFYFQQAFLYGPMAMLVGSFHIPDNAPKKSAMSEIGDPSIEFLLTLIKTSLKRYQVERLSYNGQQIKNMMAMRDEKERVLVVKEFDDLTDDQREVEKINKKLGLGKWAVGGTKLIYAYDKDYFDMERQKRIDAGIMDFPGESTGELLPPEGRRHDEYGFPVYEDGELEGEGGYNHNQHDDDDAE